MVVMTELKPCPACGSTNLKVYSDSLVTCRNNDCMMSGPVQDYDGEKWNSLARHDRAEQPPMSRERFRQETVLAYVVTHAHIAFVDISRWADELTAIVFGDEV